MPYAPACERGRGVHRFLPLLLLFAACSAVPEPVAEPEKKLAEAETLLAAGQPGACRDLLLGHEVEAFPRDRHRPGAEGQCRRRNRHSSLELSLPVRQRSRSFPRAKVKRWRDAARIA